MTMIENTEQRDKMILERERKIEKLKCEMEKLQNEIVFLNETLTREEYLKEQSNPSCEEDDYLEFIEEQWKNQSKISFQHTLKNLFKSV